VVDRLAYEGSDRRALNSRQLAQPAVLGDPQQKVRMGQVVCHGSMDN
jgi:hypothetical protein